MVDRIVFVNVGVAVIVKVGLGVFVNVGVVVGVTVSVTVFVTVGVTVSVWVSVTVSVLVSVTVYVGDIDGVGVKVGVNVGPHKKETQTSFNGAIVATGVGVIYAFSFATPPSIKICP